jgi:hypothetical protein
MNKVIISIAPALLACALAIGGFLICARMFHVPPFAIKVASIVIIGTTALTLIVVSAVNLFRSKPE